MREQENIDLVKRLRTRQPYKHALEIMADDLTQWLRDESVHDGDIFEHSIILGQGDYPSGRDIIGNAVRKMDEAADAIEALQARVAIARRDAFEAAAKVAEHLQCATCGVWFHPSKPHTDDICSEGHSSWGGARDAKDIAAAIRALVEKG